MGEWKINEDFRFVEGERDGAYGPCGYTAAEFDVKEKPPCPGCGHRAHVDAVPVVAMGQVDDEGKPVTLYICGLWECPNGCTASR